MTCVSRLVCCGLSQPGAPVVFHDIRRDNSFPCRVDVPRQPFALEAAGEALTRAGFALSTVLLTAHRTHHPVLTQQFLVGLACVLATPVRVMQ